MNAKVSLPATTLVANQNQNLVFMSTKQLASHIGCAEVTVRSWRASGIGPQFIRVTPRQVRYRLEDVEKWLQERTIANTSQAIKTAS